MKSLCLPNWLRVSCWLVIVTMTATSLRAEQLLQSLTQQEKADDMARPLDITIETGRPIITSIDLFIMRGLESVAIGHFFRAGAKNHGLGSNWRLSCDEEVQKNADGTLTLFGSLGPTDFKPSGAGQWETVMGRLSKLTQTTNGYVWTLPEGESRVYSSDGWLVQLKHPRGGFSVARDANQLATALTDLGGKSIQIISADGRYTGLQNPDGAKVSFVYKDGLLDEVTQANGGQEHYTYDAEARLKEVDIGFGTLSLEYDEQGRVVAQKSGDDVLETREYQGTAADFQVKVIDQGESAVYRQTPAGLRYTDADGIVYAIDQDARGQVVAIAINDIQVWRATTDDAGAYTEFIHHGVPVHLEYDGLGLVSRVSGLPGRAITLTYDEAARPVMLAADEGSRVELQWNNVGQCTQIIDLESGASPKEMRLEYGSQGNLLRIASARQSIEFEADAAGRVVAYVVEGKRISLSYNAVGQITGMSGPDGQQLLGVDYDTRGLPVALFSGHQKIGFQYATDGMLVGTADAAGNRVGIRYTSNNQIKQITDPKGLSFGFAYDAMGRMIGRSVPGGAEDAIEYDDNGNIVRWQRNTDQVSYAYDDQHRVTKMDVAETGTVSFSYDEKGLLAGWTDTLGEQVARESLPDAATADERLALRDQPNLGAAPWIPHPPGALSYRWPGPYSWAPKSEYDREAAAAQSRQLATNQRITYRNIPAQAQVSVTTATSSNGVCETSVINGLNPIQKYYDAAGRLVRIESPAGTFSYTYDDQGRKTSLTYPNGTHTTYAYLNSGKLAGITTVDSAGTNILDAAYQYDQGRIRQIKIGDQIRNYTYDLAGHVTEVTDADGRILEAYSYDASGRRDLVRTSQGMNSVKMDDQGRLQKQGAEEYRYDAQGRRLAETSGGQAQRSFTYSALDRCQEITTATGTVAYGYSVMGLRIWRQGVDGQKTYFLHAGDDVVAEVDANGKLQQAYVNGNETGEILASLDAKGKWVYHHRDDLQSLLLATGDAGAPVQHFSYSLFGAPDANPRGFTYLFAGGYWDNEAGLYHNRNRMYDPATGEFLTPDPIGIQGGLLAYTYCANNPVEYRDPAGTIFPIIAVVALVGAVGAVITYVSSEKKDSEITATELLVGARNAMLLTTAGIVGGALGLEGAAAIAATAGAGVTIGAVSQLVDEYFGDGLDACDVGKIIANGMLTGLSAGIGEKLGQILKPLTSKFAPAIQNIFKDAKDRVYSTYSDLLRNPNKYTAEQARQIVDAKFEVEKWWPTTLGNESIDEAIETLFSSPVDLWAQLKQQGLSGIINEALGLDDCLEPVHNPGTENPPSGNTQLTSPSPGGGAPPSTSKPGQSGSSGMGNPEPGESVNPMLPPPSTAGGAPPTTTKPGQAGKKTLIPLQPFR